MTPKYLIDLTLSKMVLPITILNISGCLTLVLPSVIIYLLALVRLAVNLLARNQLLMRVSSALHINLRIVRFWWLKTRHVSSAKRDTKNLDASAKSLIYSKKSSGPRVEPCGTPHNIVNNSDVSPLTTVNCLRLLR